MITPLMFPKVAVSSVRLRHNKAYGKRYIRPINIIRAVARMLRWHLRAVQISTAGLPLKIINHSARAMRPFVLPIQCSRCHNQR